MKIPREAFVVLSFIAITMANPTPTNEAALHAVSDGANQFSSSLFQAIIDENKGNLITSPLSVDVVLAMAAAGSSGETEKQFNSVLHLPSDLSVTKSGYQSLIDKLNNVQDVELRLANKIYVSKDISIKPSYKELTENFFRSTTQTVDFSKSAEAANTINTWVKAETKNRISEIVTPGDLDALTALVLLNAVYFKGQWKNKFNAQLTKDMPFHVNANTVKNVPTMYRQGNYKYGDLPSINSKFVEIPYKGNELSMVIILPNEIDGLAQVEHKLQNMNLGEILSQGYEREVELYLPKFKIESKVNLEEVLKKLGLINMFTDRANFSGIADGNMAVSKVIQKAFIEVNEEGSEAAAVTGLHLESRCMVYRIGLMIDRPFFYSIVKTVKSQETENRVVSIFSGCVREPNFA